MAYADGKEPHDISKEKAAQMTRKFRQDYDIEESRGFYFGRDKIQAILGGGGCVGIRVYYGINEFGYDTLVLVGVDKNWNDIGVTDVTLGEYGISTAVHADDSGSALARDPAEEQ